MFDWFTLHIAALVVTAAIFGAMLFFMAFFTPMVFRHLEREAAGAFMRKVFPTYYGVMGPVPALSSSAAESSPRPSTATGMTSIGAVSICCTGSVSSPTWPSSSLSLSC